MDHRAFSSGTCPNTEARYDPSYSNKTNSTQRFMENRRLLNEYLNSYRNINGSQRPTAQLRLLLASNLKETQQNGRKILKYFLFFY